MMSSSSRWKVERQLVELGEALERGSEEVLVDDEERAVERELADVRAESNELGEGFGDEDVVDLKLGDGLGRELLCRRGVHLVDERARHRERVEKGEGTLGREVLGEGRLGAANVDGFDVFAVATDYVGYVRPGVPEAENLE